MIKWAWSDDVSPQGWEAQQEFVLAVCDKVTRIWEETL